MGFYPHILSHILKIFFITKKFYGDECFSLCKGTNHAWIFKIAKGGAYHFESFHIGSAR